MTEIIRSTVENEVKARFINYASYVIGDRALPDIRDGLKPVQRRVTYSMFELGLAPNKSFKKSARTVGDTLGKYHPHGDTSIYEALVNLVQPWKMRYPLINGHGNFGSIDGDPAAAMRYTESKLSQVGYSMIDGINDDIVEYTPNFDDSGMEPSVLPTFFPNLLCNGTTGIAVGMATSLVPHHAKSIYDALLYTIKKEQEGEEANIDELIKIVVAPDFPTGGIIINLSDIHKAYRTGKGRVQIRSKYEIEENSKYNAIIIKEIPYRVNKARLVTQIDELRKDELKEEIKAVRDESARNDLRICIELKKNANTDFVLKKLLKSTDMQSSVSMNHVALRDGRPIQFTLKDAVESFLSHIAQIITKRSQRDLIKSRNRLHIVEGILLVINQIDDVIDTIKAQNTTQDVIAALMMDFSLTEEQAKSIADMRLRSLAQASVNAYAEEKEELDALIAKLVDVLTNSSTLLTTMYTELSEAQSKFLDERLTDIQISDNVTIDDRELIKEEDLIITITQSGMIRSVSSDAYEAKGRGTKGVKSSVKQDDTIDHMFSVNSRDDLLFFTNTGRCHLLEVYKLPVLNKNQNGKYVSNYLNLDAESDEYVVSVIPKSYENNEQDIFMVTATGTVKRLSLSSLSTRMRQTRVITFKEDDYLIGVELIHNDQEIVLLTSRGQGLCINPDAETNGVRPMGRTAAGVRGIRLKQNDFVIAMKAVEEDMDLMLITDKGFGKRVSFEHIPLKGRGGQGVIVINLTDKTGNLAAVTTVNDDSDLLIATVNGVMSRIHADTIRTMGRAAAGVKVINLSSDDEVVSISRQEREVDEDESDSGDTGE